MDQMTLPVIILDLAVATALDFIFDFHPDCLIESVWQQG